MSAGRNEFEGATDGRPAPECCRECGEPLNNAEGHAGTDLCPCCYVETVNEELGER